MKCFDIDIDDEVLDEFDQDDQEKDIGSAQMPVFENIRSHLVSPFVKITIETYFVYMYHLGEYNFL